MERFPFVIQSYRAGLDSYTPSISYSAHSLALRLRLRVESFSLAFSLSFFSHFLAFLFFSVRSVRLLKIGPPYGARERRGPVAARSFSFIALRRRLMITLW